MRDHANTLAGRYTDWIVRWRFVVIGASFAAVFAMASGVRHVTQAGNYRIFFGEDNPQLLATEAMEAVYTKGDSQVFVVHSPRGTIFESAAIGAVRDLTRAGWQTPYSTRVDSLTNYQYSHALDDDLIVEDLVPPDGPIDTAVLQRARTVARSEPLLFGNIVSRDEKTTLVAVRVEVPEDRPDAVLLLAADSRRVLAEAAKKYPQLHFEITGTGLLQAAFNEATLADGRFIWPAMLVLLVFFLLVSTRSISGTFLTLSVIFMSAAAGAGAIGHYGYPLNPVVVIAPLIILTLAVADCVHILATVLQLMRAGTGKFAAIKQSMEINLQPVFLTSLTTAVGFLVMNFSDSPPFNHLGNVTATGVGAAWLLSITFLPAALSILPVRPAAAPAAGERLMAALATTVVIHPRAIGVGVFVLFLFLIVSAHRIEVNDFPHRYFDETADFRRGTEFLENERGFFDFNMSVLAEGPGGINDPQYLRTLDRFEAWLKTRTNVVHVSSYAQIVKKLNKNMHGDDQDFYSIPDDRELVAQYLLLYEMSLPFGLDLNDMINVDRSTSKVNVLFQNAGLLDIKRVALEAESWLDRNGSNARATPAASYAVMFAYITEANAVSMVRGTLIAFTVISLILVVSLRSWSLGFVGLIANLLPVAAAIGVWALTVREANFAVSVTASLGIGIVVDDTVHFLSKYASARRRFGYAAKDAVRYAFATVGGALVTTSVVVVGGFGVLTVSSFWPTVVIGALTSITIVCALVADLLLLPALLIIFDRRTFTVPETPSAKA